MNLSPRSHPLPLSRRHHRWKSCLVALSLTCSTGGPLARAAEPVRPELVISFVDLGAINQVQTTSAALAGELNAQDWPAIPAGPGGRDWNEVPKGADPARWISVVTAGFSNRAEAYAFQFKGPGNGATLLSHVGHARRRIQGVEQWTSPFVNLLNGLRPGLDASAAATAPDLLQLEIVESAEIAEPGAKGNETALESALTVPANKVMPPLRAIVTAAACSAGWMPTLQPAPNRARVEVRVLDQACMFRIAFTAKDRQLVYGPKRIPCEEYHDQLTLLFRRPNLTRNIVDFVRPDSGSIELLAAHQNRILCLVDDELTALDSATGSELWRLRAPVSKVATIPKVIQNYTIRRDARNQPRAYRWSTALAEVSLADGKLIPLAPIAASSASSFDVAANGDVAVAQGVRLSCFSGGREAWNVAEVHAITSGPRLEEDRVLAGTERGELIAFARADHRVLWRTKLAPRLSGSIAAAGKLRLVFSNESETLTAFDPADGKTQWQFAAGDVLVQPPLEFEGKLVVVTKGNRIVCLSPETGAVVSECRWPTWVVSLQPLAVPAGPRLALNDVSGKLALLGSDLKPAWEAALGTRLTGCTILASMPESWRTSSQPPKGGADDLVAAIADSKTKSFLLTSDGAGFLYKISLDGIP